MRDAACYVCWSFARTYTPKDMAGLSLPLARGLLVVALFDREINCRRAAAAAFQEFAGRQVSVCVTRKQNVLVCDGMRANVCSSWGPLCD